MGIIRWKLMTEESEGENQVGMYFNFFFLVGCNIVVTRRVFFFQLCDVKNLTKISKNRKLH